MPATQTANAPISLKFVNPESGLLTFQEVKRALYNFSLTFLLLVLGFSAGSMIHLEN